MWFECRRLSKNDYYIYIVGIVGTSHKATSGPLQGPYQPIQRLFTGPSTANAVALYRTPLTAATGHSDQS
jgi:hypothetical protein